MEQNVARLEAEDAAIPEGLAVDFSAAQAALLAARSVSAKSLMLGSGPRFARDAFGPILAFYVGWNLSGLLVGIALATAVSVVAWAHERRQERSGNIARLSLGFVLIQAVIGLASGSASVYLAQPVLLSAAMGVAFLVSCAIGRPLAAVFAKEIYPFPDEVRNSKTFRRVFGRESLVWGVYQILRSASRLLVLGKAGVGAFILINLITGVPLTAGLISWSIWYGVRGFRRSEEWGWALRGEDPPHVVTQVAPAA